MKTAKEFLKSKGLKNPPLDSGIKGCEVSAINDKRIYASDIMEKYADQIRSESEAASEGLFNRVIELQTDADTMFNALFAIISDERIDNLSKCMETANEAVEQLVNKSIIDKKAVQNKIK